MASFWPDRQLFLQMILHQLNGPDPYAFVMQIAFGEEHEFLVLLSKQDLKLPIPTSFVMLYNFIFVVP